MRKVVCVPKTALSWTVLALLLPVVNQTCNAQAFTETLRFPLQIGGGKVIETSKAQQQKLSGFNTLVSWDCNDHVSVVGNLEMLSSPVTKLQPYSSNEDQINAALEEHFTVARVTPFISEIFGTGWAANNDPDSQFKTLTQTAGGSIGATVDIYGGYGLRLSYEVTHWWPVLGFNGGNSEIVSIGLVHRLSLSRDRLH